MSVRLRVAVTIFVAMLVLSGGTAPASAAGPTILGAGSTWSQIAIDQWRYDVVRLGLAVNYSGVGSTQGRSFFAQGSVDFGVSEIPYGEGGEPLPSRAFKYLPIVAGGTSLMYNLTSVSGQQIKGLQLSPETIEGIFTGQITNWNDPRIKKDSHLVLPNKQITIVVRADGSGTSYQFSAFLKATDPGAWGSFAGRCGIANAPTSFYPPDCLHNEIAQNRSDGVANYIANPGLGSGSIGYVEAGYAIARKFPVVAVQNKSGHYAYPTAHSVATALQHAQINPTDSTQELSGVYNAPEANAYPISSYSYMIVPTDSSISTDKGAVLGKFIIYFACTGQQEAESLGYSPMPKELVGFAFDAEKQIPGAPNPPALTGSACPNPTLTGSFYNEHNDGPPPGSVTTPDQGGNPSGTETPGTSTDQGGTGSGASSGPPSSVGPSTGASSSGGSGPSESVAPETLGDKGLLRAQALTADKVGGMKMAAAWPLIAAAIIVLLLIFGPLLMRVRSRTR